MIKCRFVKELDRLKKSSSESIDNIITFDAFKRYMHVVRNVEIDLKDTIRSVNQAGQKTLILLCGSAGDGKSHLLSYLKNADTEHLIDDYIIYNDATESSEPLKTAIDTLNDLLDEFKDRNLNRPGKNIILAINLGVLSNFIESAYGKDYSLLKAFVMDHQILGTNSNHNYDHTVPYFRSISFSDYHMFSLQEKQIDIAYMKNIMQKIFKKCPENIFYKSYQKECSACSVASKCPVKANYEYLINDNCQNYVAGLMVRTAIVDKVILTTREMLNYFYDIIVPQRFNQSKIAGSLDPAESCRNFLKQMTPALMFDYSDLTMLMNQIKKFDPLGNSSKEADTLATRYYVSSGISDELLQWIKSTPYGILLSYPNFLEIICSDMELKLKFFETLIRIHDMSENKIRQDLYQNYLQDLYYYNAGIINKMDRIYTMTEHAVIQWCGSESDGKICLNDQQDGYILYESIRFEPYLDALPKVEDQNLIHKFVPEIVIGYKDSATNKLVILHIDYSLYELLDQLNKGYVQTTADRNNHADFMSFISKILKTGSYSTNLTIVAENGRKAVIEKTAFGYKFKVVR